MYDDTKLDELLHLVDCMKDGEPLDGVRIADSREGRFYRHGQETRLALKVALITARPLLLVGPPGCGKSSLAPYVARNLRLNRLSYTVTETAEASDLLWRIDYLKRLNDAQINQLKPMEDYIEKGVLWRAFEPDGFTEKEDPRLGTIVLIDEIDKASAGFANSILVALGSLEFEVPPLGNRVVRATKDRIVLLIMTSNGERELPPALTRRCVTLRVDYPSAEDLLQITEAVWRQWMEDPTFRTAVVSLAQALTSPDRIDSRVSTAEFLDLVQILKKSDIQPSSEAWRIIEGLVVLGPEEL